MQDEAWVGTLKVADLKEQLKKRGLPTNGLKADLAERLTDAIRKVRVKSSLHAEPINVNPCARMIVFRNLRPLSRLRLIRLKSSKIKLNPLRFRPQRKSHP